MIPDVRVHDDSEHVDPTDEDRAQVSTLLGRSPLGQFSVVVRDENSAPAVIRNFPVLKSGRPMPTMYWLLHRKLSRLVGTLEAARGVDRAEAEIGIERLAMDHDRYAELRSALHSDSTAVVGRSSAGSTLVPSGGVGGTRIGVKCLHAHLAWWLVDGSDAAGAWTARELVAMSGGELPRLYRTDSTVIEWPLAQDRAFGTDSGAGS